MSLSSKSSTVTLVKSPGFNRHGPSKTSGKVKGKPKPKPKAKPKRQVTGEPGLEVRVGCPIARRGLPMESPSDRVPHGAIRVRTYEKLREWADKMADGKFNLLAVVSAPGAGKTTTFDKAFTEAKADFFRIKATTEFKLYQTVYDNNGKTFILDDVNFNEPKLRNLLLSLCDTTEVKTLQHMSAEMDKAKASKYPPEFVTSSRVVVLCNSWANLGEAMADRATTIHFLPSAPALHNEVVRRGFCKAPVLSFIADHLDLVTQPSMRYYEKGMEIQRSGMADWKDSVLQLMCPGLDVKTVLLVSKLMADTSLTSFQRTQKFEQETGMDRSTYFSYQRALREARGETEMPDQSTEN